MKYFTKLIFGVIFGITSIFRCTFMNDNPIYKQAPSDFFAEPELAVAKAIRKDNTQQITKLIANDNVININATGNHGMTLLGWACAHRYPKSVKKLLELGADPNLEIIDGDSKTHLVAITASGVSDEVFELLLNHNGNPNGKIDGTPAIFKTVYARRLDRLKLLVDKGADIDAIDKQTSTSLVSFCGLINQYEYVVWLLEQGADHVYFHSAQGGGIALSVQIKKGKLTEDAEKWRAKAEQLLIERGVQFPVPLPWEQNK